MATYEVGDTLETTAEVTLESGKAIEGGTLTFNKGTVQDGDGYTHSGKKATITKLETSSPVTVKNEYTVTEKDEGNLKITATFRGGGISTSTPQGSSEEIKITVLNKIGAEKWGFVKTKAELDSVVGAGESEYIDHDADIFYYKLKQRLEENPKHYVTILGMDNKLYACLTESAYQYFYSGMGQGGKRTAHNTDYEYVSSDGGSTWTQDNTTKAVEGKTVTLQIWKYTKDIDDEGATTDLAGSHEVVFGAQKIDCSASQSFTAD